MAVQRNILELTIPNVSHIPPIPSWLYWRAARNASACQFGKRCLAPQVLEAVSLLWPNINPIRQVTCLRLVSCRILERCALCFKAALDVWDHTRMRQWYLGVRIWFTHIKPRWFRPKGPQTMSRDVQIHNIDIFGWQKVLLAEAIHTRMCELYEVIPQQRHAITHRFANSSWSPVRAASSDVHTGVKSASHATFPERSLNPE